MARFANKQFKMTAAQAYAPTKVADKDIEENFCEKSHIAVDGVHRYDMIMVISMQLCLLIEKIKMNSTCVSIVTYVK